MYYCLQGTTICKELDYHLHTKFFTGNWSNNSLQKAINQLKVDRKRPFYGKNCYKIS